MYQPDEPTAGAADAAYGISINVVGLPLRSLVVLAKNATLSVESPLVAFL
ncbi:MAG: hypothetical protein IPJ79_00450 [Bacteroidetes bacterium]|nr:hypothetical protein [Bacteroidota bacterium]